MDSPLMVYDSISRSLGRTNSDDIYDILVKLDGIRIYKENTSQYWQRGEFVRKENPDLVIIHISAFYDGTTPVDHLDRFTSFLRQMSATKTIFLLYTRSDGLNKYPKVRKAYIKEMEERLPPELRGRLILFQFPKGGKQSFKDITVQQNMQRQVRDLLQLN